MRPAPRLVLVLVLVLVALITGCAIPYEDVEKIHRMKSSKKDVIEIIGEPDTARVEPDHDEWIYTDVPPFWPNVIQPIMLPYTIYYWIQAQNPNEVHLYFNKAGILFEKRLVGPEYILYSEEGARPAD